MTNRSKPKPIIGEGKTCPQCGGMMIRTGACHTCPSCGFNDGCGWRLLAARSSITALFFVAFVAVVISFSSATAHTKPLNTVAKPARSSARAWLVIVRYANHHTRYVGPFSLLSSAQLYAATVSPADWADPTGRVVRLVSP